MTELEELDEMKRLAEEYAEVYPSEAVDRFIGLIDEHITKIVRESIL